MMDLETAKQILAAFERERVRYALVGSMAMAVHGLVRATRDLDFFVAPDDENIDRLRTALSSIFDDPSIQEIRGEDLRGDYPAICYAPPDGEFSIDLLSRLGEAFAFDDIEVEVVDVDGIKTQVATPKMLYRMKRDTVRPQDRADAEALRQHFDLDPED